MNPIEIYKTKYEGSFSYKVCYYKKRYKNADIFIKSNLQLYVAWAINYQCIRILKTENMGFAWKRKRKRTVMLFK